MSRMEILTFDSFNIQFRFLELLHFHLALILANQKEIFSFEKSETKNKVTKDGRILDLIEQIVPIAQF